MESGTKNKQSPETIEMMVQKIFPDRHLKGYHELSEGYFNVAYEVELSDGSSVILKIAPDKNVRVMFYEKDLMMNEVNAMQIVNRYQKILAPRLLGSDDSSSICSAPYFFMERLQGSSLNSIMNAMSEEAVDCINREAGVQIRRVNDIICPYFGYPVLPEYQGDNWRSVFIKIMEATVKDAHTAGIDLKISTDELLELLQEDAYIFEEVKQPRLVHWDCWAGNIFVKNGTLTGIIDWERCIYGDPLLEVGFRTYNNNQAFVEGYFKDYCAPLTPKEEEFRKRNYDMGKYSYRRALWYDIYLLMLNSMECDYRCYDTNDMYDWATELLGQQVLRLKQDRL